MSRYDLASRAVTDLLEIVRYTKQTWGQARARHYREELDLALQRLSLSPDLGRKRDDISPSLRSHPAGQHVAFYVPRRNTILVLRILHPRMNVDAAFKEGG